MLVDGNDDYQLPLHRERRAQHRQELSGQLGKEIFGTLGGILDAVLQEDPISDAESITARRELLEEVVIVLGKASSTQGWRSSLPSIPPSLVWQVASHVRRESRAMPHTLTLMQSAELGNESYNDLFLKHRNAARMLMMALHDRRPEVRRTSSELLQNHGQQWLDIIDEHHQNLFDDRNFANALAIHIKMREKGDDPDPVQDIVMHVRHRTELVNFLLEKLYNTVIGADTGSKIDKREVLETSIEIWVQLLEHMPNDTRNRWSSASMMMVISEYIKTLKEEYEKMYTWERRQTLRDLPPWLKKYYEYVSQNRDSSATPVMYWLTESIRHYEEVLGLGYGN
ncbi:hypothetical protein FRC02_007817 [Tulasnella sp. 418]|nr:hypothetical protein FRC02_007817 [Tulasnella sp. 418]